MFDFDEIEDASWKAGFYTEPQKKILVVKDRALVQLAKWAS
jgi:hypothetical protein